MRRHKLTNLLLHPLITHTIKHILTLCCISTVYFSLNCSASDSSESNSPTDAIDLYQQELACPSIAPPAVSPTLKENLADQADLPVHQYGNGQICLTNKIGAENPGGLSPLQLVVDAHEGFIPLWDKQVVLRWTFDESALAYFSNSEQLKTYVRRRFAEAINEWGNAAPVRFSENSKVWDFKIRLEHDNMCSEKGCVLARAFLPDSGRHDFAIYPKWFSQDSREQVNALLHEAGHIFGLRHFFAKTKEGTWPSDIFGSNRPFTIMNYGEKSELTYQDKYDLFHLYQAAWSGQLTEINGTPIKFVYPFHEVAFR